MQNRKITLAVLGLTLGGFFTGCGKVKETAAEITNGLNIQGHWLMTASEHSNKLEQAIEKESMVLTFKDGNAAFAPTDSVKGKAVYATLGKCTVGPRPYHTDKMDLVWDKVNDCNEARVTVTRLDADHLKFTDPDNRDITRTFVRIDDQKYQQLVKESDRRP